MPVGGEFMSISIESFLYSWSLPPFPIYHTTGSLLNSAIPRIQQPVNSDDRYVPPKGRLFAWMFLRLATSSRQLLAACEDFFNPQKVFYTM
eukprot:c49317_g1_i1 orf=107-379(-)